MHTPRLFPVKSLFCALSFLFLASCGEKVAEEEPIPFPDSELNQQDPSSGQCPQGQRLNPFTGQCVDASQEEDEHDPSGDNGEDPPTEPGEQNGNGEDDPCGFGSIQGQA